MKKNNYQETYNYIVDQFKRISIVFCVLFFSFKLFLWVFNIFIILCNYQNTVLYPSYSCKTSTWSIQNITSFWSNSLYVCDHSNCYKKELCTILHP